MFFKYNRREHKSLLEPQQFSGCLLTRKWGTNVTQLDTSRGFYKKGRKRKNIIKESEGGGLRVVH